GTGVTDLSDPVAPPDAGARSRLLRNWRHVLRTSNPPAGRVYPVSRWLVLTRASVLPMTITAAAIAGLLAAFHDEDVRWGLFALAALGLVLAHVANNLMNDLFDLEVGSDTESYPRALPPRSGPAGPDPPPRATGGRRRRQRRRPRDPRRAVRVPRLADDRVRPGRVPALGRVHGAAAPAEEARPRRGDGVGRVGPADG